MDINFLVSPALVNSGPTYTAGLLASSLSDNAHPATVYTSMDRWDGPPMRAKVVAAPGLLSKAPYRQAQPIFMHLSYLRLVSQVKRAKTRQVNIVWGDIGSTVSAKIAAAGGVVVREKYNCTKARARDILDRAYASLGIPAAHGLTEAAILEEKDRLLQADGVFCPSPQVAESVADLGVARDRLLLTSYGWDPARFSITDAVQSADAPFSIVFVGYLCVRKGGHILLDAWRRAGIKGKLYLVGSIEPAISSLYGDVIGSETVEHKPFNKDISTAYRDATYFVFPTLEEGSALVTYEAAGCGLPVVTTPMGAGSFIRDGIEGLVVDNHDPDAWADELRRLAAHRDQRAPLSARARLRAQDFTWDKVGQRRASMLSSMFGS